MLINSTTSEKNVMSFKASLFILLWQICRGIDTDQVSIPEGLYSYPKPIFQFNMIWETNATCFVENVTTVRANGSIELIRRRYFEVKYDMSSALHPPLMHTQLSQNSNRSSVKYNGPKKRSVVSNDIDKNSNSNNRTTAADHPKSVTTAASRTFDVEKQASDYTTTASNISVANANTTSAPHFTRSRASENGTTALELLQVRDVDREKHDNFVVAVSCKKSSEREASFGLAFFGEYLRLYLSINDWPEASRAGDAPMISLRMNHDVDYASRLISINVTDKNDNTPVFNQSSLSAICMVSDFPDPSVMNISATDKDIGYNAKLLFKESPGTKRVLAADGSPLENSIDTLVNVRHNGEVFLWSPDLKPDTTITFGVIVKDCYNSAYGNRATATATIKIVPNPSADPTGHPATENGPTFRWWMVGAPVLAVVLFVVAGLAVVRVRARNNGAVLMIDDEFLLAVEGTPSSLT